MEETSNANQQSRGLLLDTLDEYTRNRVLNNLCATSKTFAAVSEIESNLRFMAENAIDPNSAQGKHISVDLESAVQKFNEAFIAHGINPNLQIHCEKI